MSLSRKKRIVAIDFGTKRIGFAVSDPLRLFAQPTGTFDRAELFEKLELMTRDEEIDKIIVGYPLNDDGTQNRMTGVIDRFIEELALVFPGLPVERVDEHRSSRDAMQILAASGISRKERNRKGRLDCAAACVILREYLEAHR
ncbi:Holliday junction resolvase RuvX [Chlorobium limicola]|uniref:Putative pre-16S rRNA nuclease n=1 Tax=Chlorobium limicola TaxID=1092 RepID=A0A117MSB8_CHLLI|nr:Holliday junction resolvase RuvX [Chlorobium limicola]KUL33117.1 Holliday junction resolvase [Chlorobium limicola]